MITLKEYAKTFEKDDIRRSVIELFEAYDFGPPLPPRPWWRRGLDRIRWKLNAIKWFIGDRFVRVGMWLGGEPDDFS